MYEDQIISTPFTAESSSAAGSGPSRLCEEHAPKVADWGDDAIEICKLWLSFRSYRQTPRDWYLETLARIPSPALKGLRTHAVRELGATDPAWIAEAQAQFDDPTFVDLRAALEFDSDFTSFHPEASLVSSRVAPRAKAWAREQIALDPYNLDALKILTTTEIFQQFPNGNVQADIDRKLLNSPSYPRHIARMLLMKPWDNRLWLTLAGTVRDFHNPASFRTRMGFYINAVAFSNHRPDMLQLLLTQYVSMASAIDRQAKSDTPDPDLMAIAADREVLVDCPTVRAARLFQAMCKAFPSQFGCSVNYMSGDTFAERVFAIQDRGACTKAFGAPLESTFFEPVEVNLSGLDGI